MEQNNKDNSTKEKEIFSKMEIKYSKSKSDIWAELESKVDENAQPLSDKKVVKMSFVKWAAAAIILVTFGLGLFAKLHTVTSSVSKGEFATHKLPDGSTVYLNAESSISYQPYWWNINREVSLEGEAFFEVQKGEQFTVTSDMGSTQVLGTSFNIFARDDFYSVYCSTGKVKVNDSEGEAVFLDPGMSAEIIENQLTFSELTENEALSWRQNKFVYNATPLDKVFKDLERHYDISIEAKKQIKSELFTGVFDREVSAEDALKIICLSFELKIEKKSKKSFRLY